MLVLSRSIEYSATPIECYSRSDSFIFSRLLIIIKKKNTIWLSISPGDDLDGDQIYKKIIIQEKIILRQFSSINYYYH